MISNMGFSQFEAINKLIAGLYNDDIPLHNRILNFLHKFTGIVYFDRATILFFYQDNAGTYTKHSSISLNWEKEQDYVKRYNEHYCHLDDTLPVMDQLNPILFRASTFFNQQIRNETAYWKEYLLPNNCIYSIEGNLQIKNSHGLKGGLALYRGGEKSDFTETDVAIVSLIQPHLSNVLKHYGETADSSSIPIMLGNYNCVGAAILDSNYQVIKSSLTYDDLIQKSDYGEQIQNKAVELCMNLYRNKSNPQKLSSEYKFDVAPIFMEVTKMPSADKRETQYGCLIYDLSYFFTQTLNQAKEKYFLTTREFEIVQAVLNGKSNEEISKELFLSLPTVKKYLASIYSKMDIKNQKQIFEKLKFQ